MFTVYPQLYKKLRFNNEMSMNGSNSVEEQRLFDERLTRFLLHWLSCVHLSRQWLVAVILLHFPPRFLLLLIHLPLLLLLLLLIFLSLSFECFFFLRSSLLPPFPSPPSSSNYYSSYSSSSRTCSFPYVKCCGDQMTKSKRLFFIYLLINTSC